MIDTVANLFKAAGYEDYKSLPVMEFVKPKNRQLYNKPLGIVLDVFEFENLIYILY